MIAERAVGLFNDLVRSFYPLESGVAVEWGSRDDSLNQIMGLLLAAHQGGELSAVEYIRRGRVLLDGMMVLRSIYNTPESDAAFRKPWDDSFSEALTSAFRR